MTDRREWLDSWRWNDREWVAAVRADIEAELLAERGIEWYQQQLATADENWNAALFQFGI